MEYRGITWESDSKLSDLLGKSRSYVYQQLKKGKTYYQIIDDVLATKNHYRGFEWSKKNGHSELSRKLGKSRSYVNTCLKKQGYKTVEEIIDHVLDKPYEYKGIKWSSDYELDDLLGKYKGYVNHCKNFRKISYKSIIDEAFKEGLLKDETVEQTN